MFFKTCLTALLGLMLLSCSDNTQPTTETVQEEPLPTRDTVEIGESDTVSINRYTLLFTPATSIDIPHFNEQNGIKISGGQMAYFTSYPNGVGLHLDNGDTLKLMHDSTRAEEYYFYALVPSIETYLVRVQYPEGSSYLLINKNNGDRVPILGLPFISPSKNYILAVNEDQIAGHGPNALQLLKMHNGSFRSEFILDLKGWGTEKVKWLSDTSLVIEKKKPLIDTAKGKIDFSISHALVNIRR